MGIGAALIDHTVYDRRTAWPVTDNLADLPDKGEKKCRGLFRLAVPKATREAVEGEKASWNAEPTSTCGRRRCRCRRMMLGGVASLPLTPVCSRGVSSGRARTPAWHDTHSSSPRANTKLHQDFWRQVRARGIADPGAHSGCGRAVTAARSARQRPAPPCPRQPRKKRPPAT